MPHPPARPLNVTVRRGTEAPEGVAPAGRRVRRWTHQQEIAQTFASGKSNVEKLIEEAKQGPDIRVSSFKDWNELAGWIGTVVDKRSEPDEAVRNRARELTRGLETPQQRLQALYNFVSTEIRYISLAYGAGALEPRTAGQVLSTLYGDCKDKHVLLSSLAKAVGIEIKPVLISSIFTVDERVPSPTQFDHMISVRMAGDSSEWEWMDTTSGVLPSGALFGYLRNKRALLIATGTTSDKPGQSTAAFVTTPADLRIPTIAAIDITGTIDEKGVVLTTRVTRRLTGELEFLTRLAFRDASADVRTNIAKEQARDDNMRDATIKDVTYTDDGPGRGVEYSYEATHPFRLTYDKPWQIWIAAPSLALPAVPSDAVAPLTLGASIDLTLTAKYDVPSVVRA